MNLDYVKTYLSQNSLKSKSGCIEWTKSVCNGYGRLTNDTLRYLFECWALNYT